MPRDFGLVAMVTTFSLLLVNFGYNGLTEAIVQREDVTHDLASTLFWINAGFGILLTIGFASAGSLLAQFYHDPLVARVAEGISLTIFCYQSLNGPLGFIEAGHAISVGFTQRHLRPARIRNPVHCSGLGGIWVLGAGRRCGGDSAYHVYRGVDLVPVDSRAAAASSTDRSPRCGLP